MKQSLLKKKKTISVSKTPVVVNRQDFYSRSLDTSNVHLWLWI